MRIFPLAETLVDGPLESFNVHLSLLHVKGFKGAIYQSFGKWEDAQAYLNSANSITDNTPTPLTPINDPGVEQSTNIHGLLDTNVATTLSPNRARASVNMSGTTHNPILVAHPSLACNSDAERIKDLYDSYITLDGSCQGKSETVTSRSTSTKGALIVAQADTPKKVSFYAVMIGHTPGIFTTWREAEAQVKG